MRRIVYLSAFVGVALSSARASAEPRDAAGAEALFWDGRKAFEAGEYPRACAKFAESQRLDPSVGTLFNLARCEEKLGSLATSWQHYKQTIGRLDPGDARAAYAKDRLADLEQRVPKLTIRLADPAPADARVIRDDVELGAASLGVPIPVDPGRHRIRVVARGHIERSYDIEMAEGEIRTALVGPGPEERGSADREAAPSVLNRPEQPPAQVAAAQSSQGLRTAGTVALGTGAAGIALGAIAGLIVLHEKTRFEDNCPRYACNAQGLDAASTGTTWSTVSTVAFAVGAVGIGAGAYLLLSVPAPTSGTTSPQRPGAVAFELFGRF